MRSQRVHKRPAGGEAERRLRLHSNMRIVPGNSWRRREKRELLLPHPDAQFRARARAKGKRALGMVVGKCGRWAFLLCVEWSKSLRVSVRPRATRAPGCCLICIARHAFICPGLRARYWDWGGVGADAFLSRLSGKMTALFQDLTAKLSENLQVQIGITAPRETAATAAAAMPLIPAPSPRLFSPPAIFLEPH